MVVQRQLVVAVSLKGYEALGATVPEVERLVEPDVLEVARLQDGEEAEAAA